MKQAFLFTILMLITCSNAFGALKTNDKAPAFVLSDRENKTHALEDLLASGASGTKGGLIVTFFASWCHECKVELPMLNSLVDEMAAKGITVVLIAVREDFDLITPLLQQLKVHKPVVLADTEGKVTKQYQVRVLPTTFFVKRDGSVKDMIYGGIRSEAAVRTSADAILH